MTNQPTFSIRDNGDGSATVFDGGIAVATIERQRGTYNVGSEHSHDYVHLQYVARGHDLRAKPDDGGIFGPEFLVSVASSSVDVAENVNPDTVREAQRAARGLYVAGRIADLRKWHRQGQLDADAIAEHREYLPKWREHGEADLADAIEAFLAEVQS